MCFLPFVYYKDLAFLVYNLDLYEIVIDKAEVKHMLSYRVFFTLCVYTREKTLERAVSFSVSYSRYSSLMVFKNSVDFFFFFFLS